MTVLAVLTAISVSSLLEEVSVNCGQGISLTIDAERSFIHILGFEGEKNTLWRDPASEALQPVVKPIGDVFLNGNCFNGQPGQPGYVFDLTTMHEQPLIHFPETISMLYNACGADGGWFCFPDVGVTVVSENYMDTSELTVFSELGEFSGNWTWHSIGDAQVGGFLSAMSDTFDNKATVQVAGKIEVDPTTHDMTIDFDEVQMSFLDSEDDSNSMSLHGKIVLTSQKL